MALQPSIRRIAVGDSKAALEIPLAEKLDQERDWRFSLQYFQGTTNALGEILLGFIDTVAQNEIKLSAARVIHRDLWDLPVDVLLEGTIMWHNEMSAQDDLFQYAFGFKLECDKLPWSEHLRTRVGFTSGVSYAEHIPIAEQLNRGTPTSSHLLHYLDITLAFNCADLSRISRIGKLFPNGCASSVDHVWPIVGIPHRSGAWGLYGTDNGGDTIEGGSNYISIGLEADF